MKGRFASPTHGKLLNELTQARVEHNSLVMRIKDAEKNDLATLKTELEAKLANVIVEITELTKKISSLDKQSGYHHTPSSPSFALKGKHK